MPALWPPGGYNKCRLLLQAFNDFQLWSFKSICDLRLWSLEPFVVFGFLWSVEFVVVSGNIVLRRGSALRTTMFRKPQFLH